MKRYMLSLMGLIAAVFFIHNQLYAQPWSKPLDCIKTAIPSDKTSGSGYTAIECGLDGTVYVGTAWYGFSGYFLAYDFRTRQFRSIVRFEDALHQFGRGLNAHGKSHTRFKIGRDGKIYGGTKHGFESFNQRPEYGEVYDGYPGGHLYVYDPGPDIFTDLGLVYPQQGIMSMCLDDKRKRIYTINDPNYHFCMYDMNTGEAVNLGPPGNILSARYMAIDDEGYVYHPGEPGYMTVFDPEKEQLTDIPLRIEGDIDYEHPYAINVGPDGSHKIYAILRSRGATSPPELIEYSTDRKDVIIVRKVDLNQIGGLPGEGISGGSTIALGKDNKMYWTCGFQLKDDPDWRLAILSYDPATGKGKSYGYLSYEGKPVFTRGVQGSALDYEGNWHCKVHSSFNANMPYAVVTIPKLTLR